MMIEVIEEINYLKTALKFWIETKFGLKLLSGQTILIKPNMGYPKPAPYTTSIELIKEVVDTLENSKVKNILIAEGSTSKSTALDNYKETGLIEALKNNNVNFIDLNTCDHSEVVINSGVKHFLPKILKEVDLRISMPVIKFYYDEQGELFLSNAIKNFFGLPPKRMYQEINNSSMRDGLHKDLHKSVVEIYRTVEKFSPFDLYICDGLKILHGEAAIGEPLDWGKIIFSDNAIKADLKVLELLHKPKPRYLQYLTQNMIE